MKKYSLILCLLTALLLCLSGCGKTAAGKKVTLNVYNWGVYISDGSEGCLDVNAAFEDYFEEQYAEKYGFSVDVNYTTYASNEDMYNKLRSGATTYDVIFPSDYMVQRLIAEDLILPLNFDNIPNAQYIDPNYQNLYYDPESAYSVPYMFGMVGVIYNTDMVDVADVGTWDLMWNEKYQGKILQFNNPRDAFGTAMYALGIDVNSTDHADWDRALEALRQQKPMVQSYVMDEIFNKMKNGSAAISAYYAGDFLTMYEGNDRLAFYYPPEGTNEYVDAMCIPACTQNKEIAELYIDFLCREEIAAANAEYTYYGSPHMLVRENEEYIACLSDAHEHAMEIMYPEEEDRVPTSYYHTLDPEMLEYQNSLWATLKIESASSVWIPVTAGLIAAGLLVSILYSVIRKRIRESKY